MQTQVDEGRLDGVVLAWLWCQKAKPASAASLASGIKAFLPAGSAGEAAKASLGRLVAVGQAERIEPAKKRGVATFRLAPDGERRAADFLGRKDRPGGTRPFGTLASYDLPALAAGLSVPADKKAQLVFGKLLSAVVAARRHGLDVPADRGPDAAKLAIVKLAVARAGGVPASEVHLKKLPPGELPALVAGPLFGLAGRSMTNLDKLLEAAAQAALDVSKPTQVKPAVVRRWLLAAVQPTAAPAAAVPTPPPDAGGWAAEGDLPTFVRHVRAAVAEAAAAGGTGVSNLRDMVLVTTAWQRFEQAHGPVSLERFKRRLSEAGGREIDLVREDLIPFDRRDEFDRAEVRNGASVYHYIRVRD